MLPSRENLKELGRGPDEASGLGHLGRVLAAVPFLLLLIPCVPSAFIACLLRFGFDMPWVIAGVVALFVAGGLGVLMDIADTLHMRRKDRHRRERRQRNA